ncbi:MAG: hypothetical protein JO068_00435 [Hyphomicrobiales bacterium]|nr:hypothetical protein [Hyphomicrobiales bacterium]
MISLVLAQAGAQLISLIVYGVIAGWYVVPWLKGRSRANALIALLWIHVFRYIALNVFSGQHTGFPTSDAGALDIAIGDVGGAVLGFVTIALLRQRVRFAISLAWLLVLETAYDTVTNIRDGIHEHLMGAASGVTWLVLIFFVPALVVSTVVLSWQLYSRRGETLEPSALRALPAAAHTPLSA